jgi:hypothetical protein
VRFPQSGPLTVREDTHAVLQEAAGTAESSAWCLLGLGTLVPHPPIRTLGVLNMDAYLPMLTPRAREFAELAARANVPVLLEGETGTGKTYLAKLIHALSPRSGQPFVRVDCATLPEGIFEGELFGHAAGAYTDAGKARAGLVEAANRARSNDGASGPVVSPCTSGGEGSSGCSLQGNFGLVGGVGCSVDCSSGYSACCGVGGCNCSRIGVQI